MHSMDAAELTAALLQGPVLSQQTPAARDTPVHLQLQTAHITFGTSCPGCLPSFMPYWTLPISPVTSELL